MVNMIFLFTGPNLSLVADPFSVFLYIYCKIYCSAAGMGTILLAIYIITALLNDQAGCLLQDIDNVSAVIVSSSFEEDNNVLKAHKHLYLL